MGGKYFPIKTDTACKLKWAWTTLYLNTGLNRSCHRTGDSTLTVENFNDFHNTPVKIADRERMLQGQWPEKSCGYCREIEQSGGFSDRMRHLDITDLYPLELEDNPSLTNVKPTILEIYFNNVCNLGCLYCWPELSTVIETENKKFGEFNQQGVHLHNAIGQFDQQISPTVATGNQFNNLVPAFWEWFPDNISSIQRLHVLGGEPFFQEDFDKLLEMFDKNPNPNCTLNVITNLSISKKKLENYIAQFKKLLVDKKLKRVDITCSLDCWGPQQEYVRWGLDLARWEENFNLLLENKWIYVSINQTISVLTIKTMPELLEKINKWRKIRKIGLWFSEVLPGPTYLKAGIAGSEFIDDTARILALMPQTDSIDDQHAYEYMKSTLLQITTNDVNIEELKKLFVFLKEKDRRRNTNWRDLFPWLIKYEDLCGIQK